VLIRAEAMQQLVRERGQEGARRAELKRLEIEALQAAQPQHRAGREPPHHRPDGHLAGIAHSLRAAARLIRPRPATRPAMPPMRTVPVEADARVMQSESGIVDELVLRLNELVQMRTLLERSGAPAAEIEKRTAEIDRVRASLARLVRETAEDYGSAA
jgi:hypothetical protein